MLTAASFQKMRVDLKKLLQISNEIVHMILANDIGLLQLLEKKNEKKKHTQRFEERLYE